ncbi:hypothetical protein BASA50_002935 [Batrachochytrium salamandrivorans]|uniref:Thioredoxin domain-containing protein n=1 Tax=Batrachochytrium salamandrivorans TaxID=1357716 RepID=A0ABQ8FL83_9FUNG|nr:hypothetical protein BASA60_010157 [Batrachochytrium salamandrivorans]KAH6577587.1 hypothetical protein BASA62_000787 [Batrachochytrium salamandrivorans]KAH6587555.1 hypothetical protein BASA61_006281 [Batrachochytrium salamandrivorans]KAH6599593.1 hypothetical protein BASA50_002935 [Batrachochytrium salamandrivorans]KAH9267995.1 hypothetical protein BASA84_000461 [Batrachochytrium salamandrivorans]
MSSSVRRPRTNTTTGADGYRPSGNTLRSFANNESTRIDDNFCPDSGGLRRFEGLEDLLTSRPAREDLVERNIIKADVSGKLAATQEQLKKQIIEDTLRNCIAARPQSHDLVEQNILKNTTADGSMQARQEELKIAQVKDGLRRSLNERKTENELVEAAILLAPILHFQSTFPGMFKSLSLTVMRGLPSLNGGFRSPARVYANLRTLSTLSTGTCASRPATIVPTTTLRSRKQKCVCAIRSMSTLDMPTKAPKESTTPADMKRMTLRSIGFFLLSGVAFLSYFYYEKKKVQAEHEAKKTVGVGKPKVGGPFSLVDHTGRPMTDLDYRGKYMLLYFGYTFCPDVCPEELEKMAEIVDSLKAMEGYSQETIVPIFVSCDPKRDSVESIREYLKDFHPEFVGLTGTYNQIRRIAKAYRLYFSAPPQAVDDDETDYLVDHSIFFYLVGPDGVYLSHFGKNETAEEVTVKIIDYIQQRRGAL